MSAPKLIYDRATALSEFVANGVMFNLNYMPDTILGGIILFALLLQSLPLATLAIALLIIPFLHGGISSLLAQAIPDLLESSLDVERCSGMFPGISYERATSMLLNLGSTKSLGVGFPSYYMLFFGTLFGYIYSMTRSFSQELEGMPQKKAAVFGGTIVMIMLVFLFSIYRIFTGCDSFLSAFVGSLAGFMFGFLMEFLMSTLSKRSLTNLMNLPLIMDRAADGKPIYVCQKK